MILTIGITSYNRINELKRCLKSIDTKYADDIEVIVSEDCSPMHLDIEKMVLEEKEQSKYDIKFYSNEKNLGYDKNLGEIIKKANGSFILFMSDDDKFYPNQIDSIILTLKNNINCGILYTSFIYANTKKLDRFHGYNHDINATFYDAGKYIYDSILFSGLVFNKEYIKNIDAERFINYNYFQVYLFLNTISKHGGIYKKDPLVICVSDGENAYGISESSGGNKLLADRKSVISNLEFNKKLIEIIECFDKDNNSKVFKQFERQYNLHSYSGLSIARKSGKKYFNEYWNKLRTLGIKIGIIPHIYYILLLVFGNNVDNLMYFFRKLLKKEEIIYD